MKLRWAGDDRILRGATALDCFRYHCHGDHSRAGQRGDVDGVMKCIAETFQLDTAYASLSSLEERAAAFVTTAINRGVMVDVTAC